jgi:hypothetical protein
MRSLAFFAFRIAFFVIMIHESVLCASQEHKLRAVVRTDSLSSVPFNRVKFVQGGSTKTYFTDADGTTPSFPFTPGVPVSLSLKQRSIPAGVCLGQSQEFTLVLPPPGIDSFNFLFMLQPVAEPILLDSSVEFYQSSPFHGRWYISPYPNASYYFSANVGLLMTPREIAGLAAYYGVAFGQMDYRVGLVFVTDGSETVGDEGMDIGLRLDTYGFTASPGIDAYFIALEASTLGSADFAVTPRSWSSSFPENATYKLTGVLGNGLNLLLLREGSSSALVSFLASVPTFPPVTSQVPGGSQPLLAGPCDPPVPMDDPVCVDSTPPTDDPQCVPSGCGGLAPEDCQSKYFKVGAPVCSDGAVPASATVGVTFTGSGGASIDLSIFGQDIEASAGGSVSVTQSVTVGPLGVGNGSGQCGQAFLRITECRKSCTVHRDKPCLACPVHCIDSIETSACVDIGLDVTSCNK